MHRSFNGFKIHNLWILKPLNYERNLLLGVLLSTFDVVKSQLRCPIVLSVRIHRWVLVLCENSHNTSFRMFCTVFLHPLTSVRRLLWTTKKKQSIQNEYMTVL